MYLNSEEEKMYDGEYGGAHQVSMKILVRLGDLFGATRLVPIKSVHISGVSYKTVGDASIDFFNALASEGGKAQVLSTLNPAGFDPEYLVKRFPQEYREKQLRIVDLYRTMGIQPTFTCTPYYIRKPRPGWHLAWAESSAVVYANSILGAWTNREGSPSSLAAALVGKAPNYGMHQAENRQPNLLIKVKSSLANETEFGALGIYAGKLLRDRVPLFEGLSNYVNDDLKQLGAGLASSGMTSIFYYSMPCEKREFETVSVETKDIRNTVESLSTASEVPDLIFIGCPHCSLSEIQSIAQAVEGRKVRRGIELWVCTSRHLKQKAVNHVNIIEKAGGHVLCDTCAIVTWIKNLGVNTMMTNSAKAAYYAPTLNEVSVTLEPLSKCIDVACA